MKNDFLKHMIRNFKIGLNAYIIRKNQKEIVALSKSNKSIYLNPVPSYTCGGNIKHYYHFIFDLLLPLSFLIRNTTSDVVFVLKDFGVLTAVLKDVFDSRIRVALDFDDASIPQIELIGMNPYGVNINQFEYKWLKHYLMNALDIPVSKKRNKIILIERVSPDVYSTKKAIREGGGGLCRSINNHKELKDALQQAVNQNYEFHNLRLENLSFKEQITIFDSAALVIAQHGAGLSNILWMHKNSAVVEFGYREIDCFGRLAKAIHLNYHVFNSQTKQKHIEVDCIELLDLLTQNKKTSHLVESIKTNTYSPL